MLEKIPRNDKIWIYGAWDGKMYSDNSKYMYLYMNNEHEEIKSIWITRSSDVVKQVREDGYVAFRRSSIKGIYYCLRASVVFVTQGRGDVFGLITAGAKIIQLWHGMGIKDVSNVLPKEKCKSKQRYNELVHSHSNEFWMVSSQEAINKYSSAFGVPTENMFITGQPKDDTFVNLCDNDFVKSIREANPGNKIVVYLPTHRGFGKDDKTKEMLSYENLAKVNEFLKSKGIKEIDWRVE
jgi:CDP-glycerol glycerophosphotransferase (TagB/SpsB family)